MFETSELLIKEISILKSIDNNDKSLTNLIEKKERDLRNIFVHSNLEYIKKYKFFLDTIKKSLINSFLNFPLKNIYVFILFNCCKCNSSI